MPTLKEVSAKMPELKASPRVNPRTGAVADFLKYLKSPKSSQQMQGLMSVLPFVDDLETTLDRVSYGEPLTTGQGMTTALRPEAKGMVELATMFVPGGRAAKTAVGTGAMALGRVGEALAERKVPEIMAQGGRPAQLLSDLAKGTISPATVFHGSPHKFTKFDSSKIGTGEGAQAYGHGLYLAEGRDVAQNYANKLTKVDGQSISDQLDSRVRYLNMLKQQAAYGDTNAAKNIPVIEKSISDLVNKGNIYQVDLPDEQIAKMLDYDKPLSKQPEIMKALTPEAMGLKLRVAPKSGFMGYVTPDGVPIGVQVKGATPENFRKKWLDRLAEFGEAEGGAGRVIGYLGGNSPTSAAQVSQALRQAGIPGIKYLDEGSRAKGEGTRNFVTFPGEEDTLRIEKINDSPLDLFLQNYKP
jgi:hypothetical protein